MKWPDWDKFISGFKQFEQKLSDSEIKGIEYFQQFQKRHPILDGMIKGGIKSLPPPLDEIVQGIYDKADNPVEGAIEVYEYLKKIEQLQKDHYEHVMKQLEQIGTDMAKEETQILIKDALVSTKGILKEILSKLRDLPKQIEGISQTTKSIKTASEEIQTDVIAIKQKIIPFALAQSDLDVYFTLAPKGFMTCEQNCISINISDNNNFWSLIYELSVLSGVIVAIIAISMISYKIFKNKANKVFKDIEVEEEGYDRNRVFKNEVGVAEEKIKEVSKV